MCGKDELVLQLRRRDAGSPPHVRERLQEQANKSGRTRITPACAGKTRSRIQEQWGSRDHPRMCGKDATQDGKLL